MTILGIQDKLERTATLFRNEARQALSELGLQPVQFDALHYLARANRYSDTLMAVTEYLGQTKGTVSQSLKVLVREELVHKIVDADDKRVVHLKVSKKGRSLVERLVPSALLQRACKNMSVSEREALNHALSDLLRSLQAANEFKTFGQCHSCVHNQQVGAGKYWCGLTQEPLSSAELELICREHEHAD